MLWSTLPIFFASNAPDSGSLVHNPLWLFTKKTKGPDLILVFTVQCGKYRIHQPKCTYFKKFKQSLNKIRTFSPATTFSITSLPKVRCVQCTEVRFSSLLSGGFTTMAVMNLPERKLAKRTSVQCMLFCARKVLNENMYILIGFSIMKITHRYVYMLVHIVHITIHNSQ